MLYDTKGFPVHHVRPERPVAAPEGASPSHFLGRGCARARHSKLDPGFLIMILGNSPIRIRIRRVNVYIRIPHYVLRIRIRMYTYTYVYV